MGPLFARQLGLVITAIALVLAVRQVDANQSVPLIDISNPSTPMLGGFTSSGGSSSGLPPTGTPAPTGNLNPHMTWKGWVFVGIVILVFIALLLSLAPMFALLGLAGVVLYLCQIITADELFSGLVNNGVLAIAMLFVIVHPVVALPMMKVMVNWILGKVPENGLRHSKAFGAGAARMARFKLCTLCLITSPFLENTPQVAMFTPLVTQHCREVGMSPSQILMPMCFCVLLGNWALLGSSSNVIISGLLEHLNLGKLDFFEMAKVNSILAMPVLIYC